MNVVFKNYVGVFLSLLAFAVYASSAESILDYGGAKYFSYNSPGNHLYINIEGRMIIKKDDKKLEYVLLAPHPREYTWRLDKSPYSDMIALAKGASTITFIMEKSGNSIISRRFEVETDTSVLHQCIDSPYGKDAVLYPPKELASNSLTEIFTTQQIYLAAIRQQRIYGVLEYQLNGYNIKIDFPIDLVNLNPNKTPLQAEWQAVSSEIPIYVGGDINCQGIRQGVVAMRNFFDTFEFVYLCGEGGVKSKNDYHCTLPFNGKLRVFSK